MKTRIIVDSTADLTPKYKARVHTVPLTVHFGDTEFVDGVTIDKKEFYEKLIETDVMPTWVNMHWPDGGKQYNILPLDKEQEANWKEQFKLPDHQFNACLKSYDRTMGIVGEGLADCQEYLATEKAARDGAQPTMAYDPGYDKAA